MKHKAFNFAVAISLLALASLARADVVTDWNTAALNAIRANRTAPPPASRALAILHASMYDAVNGITRRNDAYLVRSRFPRSASVETAAAAAGHTALSALFTDAASIAAFNDLYAEHLSAIRNGPRKNKGIQWGQHVAQTILQARASDGWNLVVPYTGETNVPGVWRPHLSFGGVIRPALLPNWGFVRPFALASGDQFRPLPPPALPTAQYALELNEVKEIGREDSATRTAEQTHIALFWANGAGTATPPGHWNQIAQIVAAEAGNTLQKNALLFALLNFGLADAGIACWDCKYTFNLWRPITAIREADTDDNPETDPDREWSPLLQTPPFPEYTSGHSTFSGAAAMILASFFGTDQLPFTVGSDFLPGTRTFQSFSEAAEESALSRLYGGIHFCTGNTMGLLSGYQIGEHVAQHFLLPRQKRPNDDDEEDD